MILKLSDTYDLELLKRQWKEKIPEIVINTISERVQMMEEAFGTPYLKNGSEFVSIIIITEETQNPEQEVDNIMEYYHLNKELYEYSEIVGEEIKKGQTNYSETMWIQGNDTPILIFRALA